MNLLNKEEENKFVIFKLDNEYYGLNIYNVKVIERIMHFTRVPNGPHYVKGVINLRGEVVPVIDLRSRFNLDAKEIDKDSRIIIINFNDTVVGFLVDASSEVIELNMDEVDNLPTIEGNVSENFIKGIGKKDGRLIMILDIEKVLDLKGSSDNED